ncbi:hypothetical protein HS088_TW13G00622 [Tripterygium wilfordii]|uniref:LisH domain and HEAT repeat-containing protein n=1 Tax=Tripterygium wilfordii TaxID=458696 RepID=A0A7J7CUI5_TRIWF|nr:hypothetical protein HS088_TW13G00622 [Tripterygium wilfordii]
MNEERSSLCNWVVNFLLEENYLLTAFELLHELLDDGRDDQAIRLKEFFSDPSQFPLDQISHFNSLRVADPQSLLEEKDAFVEKLALAEYDLRLAREDIERLKDELQKRLDFPPDGLKESRQKEPLNHGPDVLRKKRDVSFSDLGPLKDTERRDLNCAVKEYLLIAGYRLTAMTFYEEVTDQNLDVWLNTPASVPDALRHYYYQYLSSTSEAAEEKIAMLRENESLLKANESLSHEKVSLQKSKDLVDNQVLALTKSLEGLQRDLKDRENLIQVQKQSLEHQRKELNDCRAEITLLKMDIEGYRSGRNVVDNDVDPVQLQPFEIYKEDIKALKMEIERLKAATITAPESLDSIRTEKESIQTEVKVVEIDEDKTVKSDPIDGGKVIGNEDPQSLVAPTLDDNNEKPREMSESLTSPFTGSDTSSKQIAEPPSEDAGFHLKSSNLSGEAASENTGVGTIQILADALPKIVPYVLINHREELLPLMMCAIERHPDSTTRDSLTHTLFNLIKRPDEQQRGIIMDACVNLAKNVGEMRTETELLPQCWEQINHMYEERRLLVAQSCGELADFVRPEIRDSLILSIVQQLIEDSATVVREAAARNLALLLPLFPSMDKYFKVSLTKYASRQSWRRILT